MVLFTDCYRSNFIKFSNGQWLASFAFVPPPNVSILYIAVVLDGTLDYSLDDCIEYIQEDELVEITPKSVRMLKNPKMIKKGRWTQC